MTFRRRLASGGENSRDLILEEIPRGIFKKRAEVGESRKVQQKKMQDEGEVKDKEKREGRAHECPPKRATWGSAGMWRCGDLRVGAFHSVTF